MLNPSTPGKIVRLIFDLESLVHADSSGEELRWFPINRLVSEMEELVQELKETNK